MFEITICDLKPEPQRIMTKRGSIAYYLAAVVCGCFFLVVALAGLGERSLRVSSPGFRDVFLLYFLSIAYGSVSLLLFAFLLRLLARRIRWISSVEWMVGGAILACALTWSMHLTWSHWLGQRDLPGSTALWMIVFGGPVGLVGLSKGPVSATLAMAVMGAGTAFVLARISFAFDTPAARKEGDGAAS
jgi:hypothetical protein